MAEISFKDIAFTAQGGDVRAMFLKIFYFDIAKEDISAIGDFSVSDGRIIIDAENGYPQRKFERIMLSGFERLKNSINGKKAVYIHKNSGIPLIGSNAFGLVDRGTNVIEVKPITGCNLKCIYCSVDEDRRVVDFVVEKDYLVEEFNRLASIKRHDIEAHIGTQGEPLYYADLAELIAGIANNPKVRTISIDTNATMLTKKKIDELTQAGLTRFNISIDAMDQKIAQRLSGCSYNLKHVLEMTEYAASKAEIIIAPILVPGFNEKEMKKIIDFSKKLGAKIGIQNYLSYKGGRNPVKPWQMEKFTDYLKVLQGECGTELILSPEDFNIHKDESPKNPFRKGEIVECEVKCDGRIPNEKIASARGRSITISNCQKRGKIKVKITRTKHNIIYAVF